MQILHINSTTNDEVLILKEDTEIKVEGTVHLKQIICEGNCRRLVISGDTLYVNNPQHGIAIGNDAQWGLSYGRFEYSSLYTDIFIDCKEIHAHSLTSGCGIGCYGRLAAKASWFSDDCIIRDTPIDMYIYNEPLSGSTKRSVLPVYMTKAEKEAKDLESSNALNTKLLQHLAVHTFKHEASIRFEDIYQERLEDTKLDKFFWYVGDVFYKADKNTFAAYLQRAFASLTACIIDMPGYDATVFTTLYDIVGYVALCRELELFDKVAKYPLSMRYRQIIDDFTFNGRIEVKDIQNMSSFEEIHMTEELLQHYLHPTDVDYTKQCYRQWYGIPVYMWNDYYNELIDDKDEVLKTIATKMGATTVPYSMRSFKPLYGLVIYEDGLGCEVIEITDTEMILEDGKTFGLVASKLICESICQTLKAYSPNNQV